MGVPAPAVAYTSDTQDELTTEVYKNIWWHWGEELHIYLPNAFNYVIYILRNTMDSSIWLHVLSCL